MATDAEPEIRYSPGYRSGYWHGETYAFTETQAKAFGVLFDNWRQQTPDVEGVHLLLDIESEYLRLCDLFRGHAAWNTVIVKGATRGTRRLEGDPKLFSTFDENSPEYSPE